MLWIKGAKQYVEFLFYFSYQSHFFPLIYSVLIENHLLKYSQSNLINSIACRRRSTFRNYIFSWALTLIRFVLTYVLELEIYSSDHFYRALSLVPYNSITAVTLIDRLIRRLLTRFSYTSERNEFIMRFAIIMEELWSHGVFFKILFLSERISLLFWYLHLEFIFIIIFLRVRTYMYPKRVRM